MNLPVGVVVSMASLLGDKLHALCTQPFHQLQQIFRISGKAADGLYDNSIAPADILHHFLQLRALSVLATGPVDV